MGCGSSSRTAATAVDAPERGTAKAVAAPEAPPASSSQPTVVAATAPPSAAKKATGKDFVPKFLTAAPLANCAGTKMTKEAAARLASMIGSSDSLRIGDIAPNFEAQSSIGKVTFHDFIDGSWTILFSHPRDFTPVCTTELGRVARMSEQWKKRGVKVIALSVDTVAEHHKWIPDINEIGTTEVTYPIVADFDRKVSVAYGMLNPQQVTETGMPLTVRSTFIIDPKKVVKLILTYPASTGRNFDEILRCIDSLQLTATRSVATPVDWKVGDKCVILPSVNNDDATKMFPAGFTTVRPYLRYTVVDTAHNDEKEKPPAAATAGASSSLVPSSFHPASFPDNSSGHAVPPSGTAHPAAAAAAAPSTAEPDLLPVERDQKEEASVTPVPAATTETKEAAPVEPALPVEMTSEKSLRLGDIAPDFEAQSSMGPIKFHSYIAGSWAVFFSHPRDFTPVCTTELGRVAQLTDEWKKRNVRPIALSVDSVSEHARWIPDINEIGSCDVQYPILADDDRKVSIAYSMLSVEQMTEKAMPITVRSVFIIDDKMKIRLILTYPASTGRNFDEILRCVDSLQLADTKKVATPADWQHGQPVVILPSVTNDDAAKLFPGFTTVRPYLRYTPDPTATPAAVVAAAPVAAQ